MRCAERPAPILRVALTRPSPSLINRANRVPIRAFAGFHGRSWGDPDVPSPRRDHRRTNREADLSTEQACTQAPSRFPHAHGHQRWAQGAFGTALTWAQAAFRLTASPRAARVASMERLRQRADFLAAASGIKSTATAFVLQARRRIDDGPARFGFTVSKKVGNAVERNRVRRRLREIVRGAGSSRIRAGHDYVLIGRRAALKVPFARIAADFEGALQRVHAGRNDKMALG